MIMLKYQLGSIAKVLAWFVVPCRVEPTPTRINMDADADGDAAQNLLVLCCSSSLGQIRMYFPSRSGGEYHQLTGVCTAHQV
jgi:hypothetical protein